MPTSHRRSQLRNDAPERTFATVRPGGRVYAAAASAASRVRQKSRSCGARTAGSGSVLDVLEVGPEALAADDPAVLEREQRALAHLALAQPQPAVALDDLERELRRGEEDAVAALADPQRPAHAAREEERRPARARRASAVAIAPRRCSSARASFREWAAIAKIASESTVIRGSARAQEWGASSSSSFMMIPLWIPTTGPWRTGWLLAAIDGWPFV